MHYIGEHILHALATGQAPEPMGNRVPWTAPHGMFPAAGDDQWIAIVARDDAAFQTLCTVMARPDLAGDARFATLPARLRHQDDLEAAIADWTRGQDKHEAAERLQSVGVPAAPVNDAGRSRCQPLSGPSWPLHRPAASGNRRPPARRAALPPRRHPGRAASRLALPRPGHGNDPARHPQAERRRDRRTRASRHDRINPGLTQGWSRQSSSYQRGRRPCQLTRPSSTRPTIGSSASP